MFSPLKHREGIIDTETINFVHSKGFKRIIGGFIAREMGGRTGWRKSAGQRKNDHFFIFEDLVTRHILPAIGIITTHSFISHARFKDNFWYGLTFVILHKEKRRGK
jgi:hypothetical protein